MFFFITLRGFLGSEYYSFEFQLFKFCKVE